MQPRIRSHTIVLIAILGAGFLGLASTASAQKKVPKSEQVLKCLAANIPDQAGAATITITSHGSAGTTRYRWRLYWRSHDDKRAAVIQVIAPAAVAGSAYLVRQTESGREIYLYTPAVDAVRQIQSDSGGTRRIFGTHIALRDVLGVGEILANGSLAYMGEKRVHGQTTDRMLALPPPGAESPYARISVLIGQSPCVLWKLQLSSNKTDTKTYMAAPESLRQTQSGMWYPAKWTLRTSGNGTTATIRITDLKTSPDFAPGRFQPDSFYQ